MKFVKDFNRFLRDVVNLNQTRLNQLDSRVDTLESYLREHEQFRDLIVQTIPQGSWAHQTIIRPQNGREFDADFLLELTNQQDWAPRDYLSTLRRAFRDSEIYQDIVVRKNRCVRITYAGDCHIDIAPFVRNVSIPSSGWIVNWADDKFEPTSPEAFTAWFDECNQAAGGHLQKVCRLVKYLRDIKSTFVVKSIILTTLLANQVERSRGNEAAFSDVPTALRTLVTHLSDYLSQFPSAPPSVPDPSTPGGTFDHRWPNDLSLYRNFRARIQSYAEKITYAYDATDSSTSLRAWQDVFGVEFKVESLKEARLTVQSARPRDDGEMFIDDPEFGISVPDSLPHRVGIQCRVLPKVGFRDGDLTKLGHVSPDRQLEFNVRYCSAPKPFQVYWKIKNTGPVAIGAGCPRGDIHYSDTRVEPTAYRGQHWVECYIVQNGQCVARQRYTVRIR